MLCWWGSLHSHQPKQPLNKTEQASQTAHKHHVVLLETVQIQCLPGLASDCACCCCCCCCCVTIGVCCIPCVVIGADVCRPCTPIGAGWMPCAVIGAGWIPWVLICADGRPIRSTAISCMWFRWTVVATPTPAWVGSAELGAWGVT